MNSDLIKKMRKEKGLTQQQLATLSGVSLMTVKNCENNKLTPKYSTLKKIATVLGATVSELRGKDFDKLSQKRVERLAEEVSLLEAFDKLLQAFGYSTSIDIDKVISSHNEEEYDENGAIVGISEVIDEAEYITTLTNNNVSAVFTQKQYTEFQNKVKEYINGLFLIQHHKTK